MKKLILILFMLPLLIQAQNWIVPGDTIITRNVKITGFSSTTNDSRSIRVGNNGAIMLDSNYYSRIPTISSFIEKSRTCSSSRDDKDAFVSAFAATDNLIIDDGCYYINSTLTIPAGKTLIFEPGGKIEGTGTITGNNTKIQAGLTQIFDTTLTVSGFNVTEAYPEWFGANSNDSFDDTRALEKITEISKNIKLQSGRYLITRTLRYIGINYLSIVGSEKGRMASETNIYYNNNTSDTALIVAGSTYPTWDAGILSTVSGISIRDLYIQINNGVGIALFGTRYAHYENMYTIGGNTGILIDDVITTTFLNCGNIQYKEYGLQIGNVFDVMNGALFYGYRASGVDGAKAGIYVKGGGYGKFDGILLEGNTDSKIKLKEYTNIIFDNIYTEGHSNIVYFENTVTQSDFRAKTLVIENSKFDLYGGYNDSSGNYKEARFFKFESDNVNYMVEDVYILNCEASISDTGYNQNYFDDTYISNLSIENFNLKSNKSYQQRPYFKNNITQANFNRIAYVHPGTNGCTIDTQKKQQGQSPFTLFLNYKNTNTNAASWIAANAINNIENEGFIIKQGSNQDIILYISDSTATTKEVSTGVYSTFDDKVNTMVISWDGISGDTILFYFNGIVRKYVAPADWTGDSYRNWKIGSAANNNGGMTGEWYDAMLFDTTLTLSEIQSIIKWDNNINDDILSKIVFKYSNGKTADYWYDESGNNNDAVITGLSLKYDKYFRPNPLLQSTNQKLSTSDDVEFNSVKLGTISTPSTPNAGQIYFDGTNFYGYNGSAWVQLDN